MSGMALKAYKKTIGIRKRTSVVKSPEGEPFKLISLLYNSINNVRVKRWTK